MVTPMSARRRSTSAHDNCSRISIASLEWARPIVGKSVLRRIIERVVEVLSSISTSLDHHDSSTGREPDYIKVVRPPLYRNVAELIIALLKTVTSACTMQFDKDYVTGA